MHGYGMKCRNKTEMHNIPKSKNSTIIVPPLMAQAACMERFRYLSIDRTGVLFMEECHA